MNYERPRLLAMLAGGYVLGTMSPRARRRFAALHAQSIVVQHAVADWNNRLDPLYRALPAHGAPVPIANVPAAGMRTVMLGAPAEDLFTTVPRLAVSFEADPDAAQPTTPFVLTGPCVKFW